MLLQLLDNCRMRFGRNWFGKNNKWHNVVEKRAYILFIFWNPSSDPGLEMSKHTDRHLLTNTQGGEGLLGWTVIMLTACSLEMQRTIFRSSYRSETLLNPSSTPQPSAFHTSVYQKLLEIRGNYTYSTCTQLSVRAFSWPYILGLCSKYP